jgi:hypothetical protein
MDSEPNTPILASDPAGDQATMLAAKRSGLLLSWDLPAIYVPNIERVPFFIDKRRELSRHR